MRQFGVLVLCLACSMTGVAVASTTTGPVALDFTPFGADHVQQAKTDLAPADASFGKYQMSPSGIENAIHHNDGTNRLDDGPIAYAVDALRDWEHRFPRDPWIARDLFFVQRVYEHARTYQGLDYAQRVAKWLHTDYGDSMYARWSGWDLMRMGAPPASP